MHELYKVISDKIEQGNFDYRLRAGVRKKFKTFNVGKLVMVQFFRNEFPPGTIKKLHPRSAGPFKILTKLNDNAYVIDLPEDFEINSTFNLRI